DKSKPPVPVVLLRQALPRAAEPLPARDESDEALPGFDDVSLPPATEPGRTDRLPGLPVWPSLAWDRGLIATIGPPALPAEVAYFALDGFEYLVEEVPQGRPLWDAWDDLEATWAQRFGWLVQVAETLHLLHNTRVMYEGLRPDVIVVTDEGQARLTDLADL